MRNLLKFEKIFFELKQSKPNWCNINVRSYTLPLLRRPYQFPSNWNRNVQWPHIFRPAEREESSYAPHFVMVRPLYNRWRYTQKNSANVKTLHRLSSWRVFLSPYAPEASRRVQNKRRFLVVFCVFFKFTSCLLTSLWLCLKHTFSCFIIVFLSDFLQHFLAVTKRML